MTFSCKRSAAIDMLNELMQMRFAQEVHVVKKYSPPGLEVIVSYAHVVHTHRPKVSVSSACASPPTSSCVATPGGATVADGNGGGGGGCGDVGPAPAWGGSTATSDAVAAAEEAVRAASVSSPT